MPTEQAGHCVQYAFVGDVIVMCTEALSDDEVRAEARTRPGAQTGFGLVERYDRCPACEVWTRSGGKLRAGVGCPAVLAARAREG